MSAIEWVQEKGFEEIRIEGHAVGWMTQRPGYCDRGRWQVNIVLNDIDGQDGFPRYYMRRETAVQETEDFLRWRLWKIRP